MNFSVEVLESITKVKREYWNELFYDPIFSYDWLLAFEKCGPLRIYPRHIMATNKNKIVALLPCFLQYEELYSTIEDRILGRLRPWSNRIGFRISPALIAYSPLMYKSTIGISEHKYQKELIIKLLRTMDEVAEKEKTKIYGFNFLSQDQSNISQVLYESSFFKSFVVPNTYLDISWKDFDGYISYLKKHHCNMPGNVRREIRKSEKSGIQTEKLTDFKSLTENFSSLFSNTYYRHTQKNSSLNVDFFDSLATHCQDTVTAYCAFKGDQLRAFSIFLEGSEIWHLVLSGQKYEDNLPDYSYFNVFFYKPIQEAIREKKKRIYFGPANYEAKMRRGCTIEPLFMYLNSSKFGFKMFLKNWFKITENWYGRKYKGLLLKNDLLSQNT